MKFPRSCIHHSLAALVEIGMVGDGVLDPVANLRQTSWHIPLGMVPNAEAGLR